MVAMCLSGTALRAQKIREARLARLDPKRTFFGDELFGNSRFVLRELEGRIAVEVIGVEEFLTFPPTSRV